MNFQILFPKVNRYLSKSESQGTPILVAKAADASVFTWDGAADLVRALRRYGFDCMVVEERSAESQT